jgi:hypothetical protein
MTTVDILRLRCYNKRLKETPFTDFQIATHIIHSEEEFVNKKVIHPSGTATTPPSWPGLRPSVKSYTQSYTHLVSENQDATIIIHSLV